MTTDNQDTQRHYDTRLDAIQEQIDLRFAGAEKLIETRFAAMQMAVDKAAEVMNIRLESMNEFRGQITDERGTYIRREQMDAELRTLQAADASHAKDIGTLSADIANTTGRRTVWGIVGGAAGGIIAALIVGWLT